VTVVLSKREKYYIGIGAIAAVALLGINGLIVGPYFEKAAALQDEMRTAAKTLGDNKNLIRLKTSKESEWNAMLSNGLQADDSTAQSRTQQMIQTWARVANINLEAINSEHVSTQKGPFQVINFSLDFDTSGADSMRQIARFLWSIESAHIPIRLNDIKIQSTREGTDQLNVKLVVSALYMPPPVQSTAAGSDIFNELEGMP
jgi:hypothetical protein